jgi:AraC-like DNA-binding protein
MEPRRNEHHWRAPANSRPPVAVYRELAPCAALQRHVYAFFSFAPASACAPTNRAVLREAVFRAGDSFCSPLFADGHVSIVLGFGKACDVHGRWHVDPLGPSSEVIGPMTVVGPRVAQGRPEMVGVYFRAAQASSFLHVPISELTDRVVGVADVWGTEGAALPWDLCDLHEAARIDRLEAVLLERLERHRARTAGIDAAGLAAGLLRCGGHVTVEQLAAAAGVSRQHLARVFRERVGLAPKTFCNLARFQSSLIYAGRAGVDWAQAASALGYADQSHMIAEYRRFSGLTPQALTARVWFHPFIWRARGQLA